MRLTLALAILIAAAALVPTPATAQLAPCPPPPIGVWQVDLLVDAALRGTCSSLSNWSAVSSTARQLDSLCTPGGDLLRDALWTTQATNMREACGNLYGASGYSGIKPCQPPTQIGHIGAAMAQVHHQARGEIGCDPNLRDQLNATAAAESNATAGAGPSRALNAFCTVSGEGDARRGACRALHGSYRVGTTDACTLPQVSQRVCHIVLWPVIDDILP